MTRQEANLQIIEELKKYFEKEETKDIRFCQGLFNLSINEFTKVINRVDNPITLPFLIDKYSEESTKTLDKLKEQK